MPGRPPTTVASSKDWFVSAADVPTVMRMKDGTIVANWYPAVDFRLEAYDIRLAYSKDEGKTWSRPLVPHHDKTRTQHGFVSMFEMPAGGLGLVWLDGRNQGKQPEDAEMALYFGSFDTSWKQTAEVSANARVCECCTTSAVVTPDGVVAAFRDRSAKEIRDIQVTRLENGKWSDAQIVHADNWEIDACPVNGPALSARGRQLAAAWFTGKDDKGQAFAAFSDDAGRTWGNADQARRSGVAGTRRYRAARRRLRGRDVGGVRRRPQSVPHAAHRVVGNAVAVDHHQRQQPRERLPARRAQRQRAGVYVDGRQRRRGHAEGARRDREA